MHVIWLSEFLCTVMGKLVILEKSLDSHQHYKPPWFHILHSSINSLVALFGFGCCEIEWFRCEHGFEMIGDSVYEGSLGNFVVYYPTFFTDRGNF